VNAYSRLFNAGLISNISDGFFWAFLPLLAAYTYNDPRFLGIALSLKTASVLVMGISLNYVHLRPSALLLKRTSFLRAILTVPLFVYFIVTGNTTIIYVLVIINGCLEMFVDTVIQALVPSVVDPQTLSIKNQRMQVSFSIFNDFLSPNFVPVLFALMGSSILLVVSGGYASAFLIFKKLNFKNSTSEYNNISGEKGSVPAKEAIRLYSENPKLRLLLLASIIASLSAGVISTVFPFIVVRYADVPVTIYGVFPAAFALGSLVTLIVGRFLTNANTVILLACLLFALSSFAIGYQPNLYGLIISQILAGFGFATWTAVEVYIRQIESPERLLLSSISTFRAVEAAAFSVGAALVAWLLNDTFNLRLIPYLVGIGQLCLLVFLMSRYELRGTFLYIKGEGQ